MIEQLETTAGMTPHSRLEFAKMSVRTKALEIMACSKRKENRRLSEIEVEIAEYTRLLTVYADPQSQTIILRELEELTQERNSILNKQGEKLATRAKTKWYNEGERSNKYFLNLLKRQHEKSEMRSLLIDNNEVSDPEQIRREVTQFYQDLYNADNAGLVIDETFLDEMFRVGHDENAMMNSPVTLNELWSTLKPTKATTPGPDGLSNTYLKKLWDVLGPLILDAWNYSIQTGMLPPSHKTSLLRLIPKAGKDSRLIKNWRPITLSNCDHKLITRLYNKRLLAAIEKHIVSVQTAYIKGRSIADNLRLLNAAVKLADVEENINATIIALDAQKAFDSVDHTYIGKVLDRVGLSNFVPIFKLLYRDLKNDIIINGRIGKGYAINNGVKQGDALSCSLFVLAIEPMLRNIASNGNITALTSTRLNYTWPKMLAYADDITVLTQNEPDSVKGIFGEYYRLTRASGLKLNADKTEKFDITSRNIVNPHWQQVVQYGEQAYTIASQDSIKINGIMFKRDVKEMRQANFEIMHNKMCTHFKDWGNRSLSILGKVQIIKTFGISQYLYTLAVTDLEPEHWQILRKDLNKFLWNKTFNLQSNLAPHRMKKEILHTSVMNGGFGMIEMADITVAARLRRYTYLQTNKSHPIAGLQTALGAGNHLQKRARMNIEDVTSGVMALLHRQHMEAYGKMTGEQIMTDHLLHRMLLGCTIRNVVREGMVNSIEMATLRRRRTTLVVEALIRQGDDFDLLCRVADPVLIRILRVIRRTYRGAEIPEAKLGTYLYDEQKMNWAKTELLTTKQIRLLIKKEQCILTTKLLNLTARSAVELYAKIAKLKNVQNKAKMLRLIHGDVYCGSRTFRFGLTDSDRCIRCFGEETITHLLYECPYTSEVWARLGLFPNRASDVLHGGMTQCELEVMAELISALVFRKKVLPPEVLISSVMSSFKGGLSNERRTTAYANNMVDRHELTGQWFT
jgi:hypothetical protein